MAKAKPAQTSRGPRQVSYACSVTFFDEEIGLIDGVTRALKHQGVPVVRDNGLTNKLMVLKEAVRIAAETLGKDTGDKALVELATQLKWRFRMPKALGGGDGRAWRKRIQRPTASAPRRAK